MKRLILVGLVCLALVSAGCASAGRNTGAGTFLGGALGAGTGAIVGHQVGDTGAGAAIGAGVGALTGLLIGNALDRSEQEADYRAARTEAALYEVRAAQSGLSILDVIRMSQAGVSDEVIMAKIDRSGTVYDLTTAEIIDLKSSAVSDRVIAHMLRSGYPAEPPREIGAAYGEEQAGGVCAPIAYPEITLSGAYCR